MQSEKFYKLPFKILDFIVDTGKAQKMSEEIIMITEFARRKGVQPESIRERIRVGTITRESLVISAKGRVIGIKVALAEKDILERGSAQNSMIAQLNKKKKMITKTPEAVVVNPVDKPIHTMEKIEGQEAPVPVTKLPEMDSDFSRYQKAKASSEELKARKLEIEMNELEGRLIDKEEVRKVIFKMVSETKETLLNIPSRVAPDLMACKDLVEFEVRLLQEINAALMTLSRVEKKYE
jgi:hypothetical protein